MSEIKLMPYTIDSILDYMSEVPRGVQMIEAPQIWDESDQGSGNVVAVIDTGVQMDHPE